MEERMIYLFEALHELGKWRKKMDAQVTALAQNVATLQSDVAAILAQLQSVQQQLAAGIDAGDEAAITQANANLVAVNASLAAALTPAAGASGATGGTGATGA
jgi:Tfp pilus assembly protein FimV